LLQDPADLLEALHRDTELSFSLAELGEIIGKDKSTVSRMLNSRNKSVRSHG
jgi:DNA-binding IclR family transcriptional regulator